MSSKTLTLLFNAGSGSHAFLKVMFDIFHLSHQIRSLDDFGMRISTGDNQFNLIRFGSDDVQNSI